MMLRAIINRLPHLRYLISSDIRYFTAISSAQAQESTEPRTIEQKEDSTKRIATKRSEKRFPNKIFLEGVAVSDCEYVKDERGHINIASFMLRHDDTKNASETSYLVKAFRPSVIKYALTRISSGSHILVEGRLGKGGQYGGLSIIANNFYTSRFNARSSGGESS